MKCIVNKLFIGALFLLGALVCSCQNTTENTVESSVEGKDTLGFKYIDIVHITHTDYGYTDHALIAVDLHKRFIDVALDLALKTKDEIPENRFAWTVEALDPFYSWVWRGLWTRCTFPDSSSGRGLYCAETVHVFAHKGKFHHKLLFVLKNLHQRAV